jgi:hypothetical protein
MMPSPNQMHVRTLTTAYSGIPQMITSPVEISAAFLPGVAREALPRLSRIGIWDTGATNTVVTQDIIETLHLRPVGMKCISTSGGMYERYVYLISLTLESHAHFPVLEAVEGHILGSDVLIGMDVITQGDFAITNKGGMTTFSFRTPSLTTIDFGQEPDNA